MDVPSNSGFPMDVPSNSGCLSQNSSNSEEELQSTPNPSWVPDCPDSLLPKVGMIFNALEEGINFYRAYASEVGFDVRKTTTVRSTGSIVWQYVVCSREGKKHFAPVSSKDDTNLNGDLDIAKPKRRRRISNRVGCKARITFRLHGPHGYIVTSIEYAHNHPLASIPSRPFLKINRNMDLGHKKFILNCAKANIGAMKSYRLFKESVGGYSNVGATAVDFKNFKRDLKAYIADGDAQMIIDKLYRKSEVCPDFRFVYDVDDSDQLTKLFWSDPVARKNYAMYGDFVSFDATYNTNRYKLVFAPFTGVDNHRRCITYGFGIISREDIASYTWLFRCFLNAMGNNAPKLIITDQDPSMRVAIKNVFPETKHRYCMWHIMNKVSEKVGPILSQDTVFMTRINEVVWTQYLDPKEWKKEWRTVLSDYNLTDHPWFNSLWSLRKFWILAYFRDLFMAGLLRTTSLSESENSFFGEFTDRNFSLVEFLMQFESAMDSQRHKFAIFNHESESGFPVFKTPLLIEKHAASVYTLSVFYDVQKEICAACFSCCITNLNREDNFYEYSVSYVSQMVSIVHYESQNGNVSCTCKNFQRIGLLCRHIFLVFKNLNIQRIPEAYLTNRWCKFHLLKPMYTIDDLDIQKISLMHTPPSKPEVSKLWSDIHHCVALVENNLVLLQSFAEIIKQQKEFLSNTSSEGINPCDKNVIFESFCGVPAPGDVRIHPPVEARNKGSGRRIKSTKETRIEESKKSKRLCRTCNEYGFHDSRNCPMNSEH